jgi:hypothetical protein
VGRDGASRSCALSTFHVRVIEDVAVTIEESLKQSITQSKSTKTTTTDFPLPEKKLEEEKLLPTKSDQEHNLLELFPRPNI